MPTQRLLIEQGSTAGEVVVLPDPAAFPPRPKPGDPLLDPSNPLFGPLGFPYVPHSPALVFAWDEDTNQIVPDADANEPPVPRARLMRATYSTSPLWDSSDSPEADAVVLYPYLNVLAYRIPPAATQVFETGTAVVDLSITLPAPPGGAETGDVHRLALRRWAIRPRLLL